MSGSPFRKKFDLSNGDSITWRKLTAIDFIEYGQIPTIHKGDVIKPAPITDDAPGSLADGMTPEATKDMITKFKFMVIRGVVAYHHKGQNFKIVDKDDFDCAENEISAGEIDPEVFAEIANKITEESGEDADATRFLGKPDTTGDDTPDGNGIREDTSGNNE